MRMCAVNARVYVCSCAFGRKRRGHRGVSGRGRLGRPPAEEGDLGEGPPDKERLHGFAGDGLDLPAGGAGQGWGGGGSATPSAWRRAEPPFSSRIFVRTHATSLCSAAHLDRGVG